jgi:SAM-dependent methyltransferase
LKNISSLKVFEKSEEITLKQSVCPGCGSVDISLFYHVENVPAHSVLLMPSREIALNYPRGDIALGFCHYCGFISNFAFDAGMLEYSSRCEETQGFSPTFNAFHQGLAAYLISRFDLRKKGIMEIGCGKGEFLTLLCELGDNRGVGFDPAYVSGRNCSSARSRITFIKDFFSEKYADYQADFICCKMTLEHIHQTADFLSTVRRLIGDRYETIVFFQVPNVLLILREITFWDIYYEHCSYFSAGTLAGLFRNCGFDVIGTWTDYDGQYVMMEARAGRSQVAQTLSEKHDLEEMARSVMYFAENCQAKLQTWKAYLQNICKSNQRAVLWGSGSKAVSLLTTLKVYDEIEYVVDINSYRQGTFIPGSGQEIVSPAFLREYKPDIVIVMNPIYREEIQQSITSMGLSPQLITVLL